MFEVVIIDPRTSLSLRTSRDLRMWNCCRTTAQVNQLALQIYRKGTALARKQSLKLRSKNLVWKKLKLRLRILNTLLNSNWANTETMSQALSRRTSRKVTICYHIKVPLTRMSWASTPIRSKEETIQSRIRGINLLLSFYLEDF